MGVVSAGYRRVLRPVLFAAYGGDAERVHDATLNALGLLGGIRPARGLMAAVSGDPGSRVTVAGIEFPGLVGLAAAVQGIEAIRSGNVGVRSLQSWFTELSATVVAPATTQADKSD